MKSYFLPEQIGRYCLYFLSCTVFKVQNITFLKQEIQHKKWKYIENIDCNNQNKKS